MTEGTRSNLWSAMREAIATIKPRFVLWENVGGAYSAQADSSSPTHPTPNASDGTRGGAQDPEKRREGGHSPSRRRE